MALGMGTRQPCPGTLELTKTLPCALLTSVHYELQQKLIREVWGHLYEQWLIQASVKIAVRHRVSLPV